MALRVLAALRSCFFSRCCFLSRWALTACVRRAATQACITIFCMAIAGLLLDPAATVPTDQDEEEEASRVLGRVSKGLEKTSREGADDVLRPLERPVEANGTLEAVLTLCS